MHKASHITECNKKRAGKPHPIILTGIGIYLITESTLAAPSGGQLLREIEQQQKMDTPSHQQPLQLDINRKTESKTESNDSNIAIPISEFIFRGNRSIDDKTLNTAIKDSIKKEYTLNDLQKIASKIEKIYQGKNYTFVHAFIPPQEVNNGVLVIEIKEGQYGEIKINNKSKLKNTVIENSIRSIKSQETIQSKKLESALIRLNQIPGIDAKSTLEPGTNNGQADLIIDIEDASAVNGDLSIDNFGDKDTGTYKTGGSMAIKNLSGRGDQLNLGIMASNLDNQYQRIAYQLPTNISDSTIGFSYSSIQYKVGGTSRILNLSGNAISQGIYLQQPIISQIDKYADIKIQYEDRIIKDKGDQYGGTIKKQINVISMTLSGGGVNIVSNRSLSNFSVTYSSGRVAVHNPDWDEFYQKTRRFQGGFSKLLINTNQTKWLTNKLNIFGQVYAQWADKNLDSSEKIGLGGPYGVRAYSASDDSGDIGFITNIELRHAILPQTQLSAFYDYGKIRLNKNGWGRKNPFIQRAAMGAALEWSSKHGSIKLISALPIAPGKSTLAKKAPSIWIQSSYSF